MKDFNQHAAIQWTVSFIVGTRDDNILASSIIATALSPDTIVQNGYVIAVNGGVKDGKTAILDSILFTLMNDKDPHSENPDTKMFLEECAGQAGKHTVKQSLKIHGKPTNVGFRNIFSLQRNRKYLKKKAEETLTNGGIFMISYSESGKSAMQDISSLNASILISTQQLNPRSIWEKRWTVDIASRFRTPEMAQALYSLRNTFHNQFCAPQDTTQPTRNLKNH